MSHSRMPLSSAQKRQRLKELLAAKIGLGNKSPLSFGQERLWFLDQLHGSNAAYHETAGIRLDVPVRYCILLKSMQRVVRRHEILRSVFAMSGGQPTQIVRPVGNVALRLYDLTSLEGRPREAVTIEIARSVSRTPFDLSNGPLMRTALVRLSDADHIVFISLHHIVADARSVEILTHELFRSYASFYMGEVPDLPELPVQYSDFANSQRQRLQGDVLHSLLDYWRSQLKDLPPLQLHADHPRTSQPTFRGDTQDFSVARELVESLREVGRSNGCTLFMTMLAAFQVLLAKYSGQQDVAVGSPISVRDSNDLQELVGLFLNMLVLRTDTSGNPTFEQLLSRVRTVCLNAYEHQELPYERLVQELRPKRDLSHQPLFQVAFVLHQRPGPVFSGMELRPIRVNNGTSKFDLTMFLWESSEGFEGSAQYNSDLFEPSTIGRLIAHFQTLLQSIASDPRQPLSELALMPPEQMDQLMRHCHSAHILSPPHVGADDLSETPARRTELEEWDL